ncbi:MAG: phage tail protein [bacterium]|nr:phage tail protein [bacterium]
MSKAKTTVVGRKKLCQAHAGDIVLPPIVVMAFGSGGCDADGNVREPTGEETSLHEELLRKELESHSYPQTEEGEITCRYTVRLSKEELAGTYISEQGLCDEEGDLIAYKTFLPKGKDADMEFIFDMDEIF